MPDLDDPAERLRAAADPRTPQAALAQLAFEYPETRALVARNPSSYDGLIEWLGQFSEPEIVSALETRRTPEPEPETGALTRVLPTAPGARGRFASLIRQPSVMIVSSIVLVAIIVIAIVAGVTISNRNAEARAELLAAAAKFRSSHTPDPVLTATPPPVSTPTAAPTVPRASIVPFGFATAWKQGFSAAGGYTEQVIIGVGTPEAVGTDYPRRVSTGECETYVSGDSGACLSYATTEFSGGTTCSANKTTDAIVPVTVDTTSTTANFKQVIGSRLQISYNADSSDAYLGMARDLEYEATYSDSGATCGTATNGILVEASTSTDSVVSGTKSSTPIFIIIPNYYTPDHPDGDPRVLKSVSITVSGNGSDGTAWTADPKPVVYQSGDGGAVSKPPFTPVSLG
jgi:hypothetical protein